jgi:hypothetical protein
VFGCLCRYWEAKLSAWTFINAIEVKRCVVSALSWWALIHCILMSMYSYLDIYVRSETISAFAGGRPWCLLHEMKSNLAMDAVLSLHMYELELVDTLWNSMNSWRKSIAEAIPKSSSLVELFWAGSPSMGPEHCALCSEISVFVRFSRIVHAKELLLSCCIEPSVTILHGKPSERKMAAKSGLHHICQSEISK